MGEHRDPSPRATATEGIPMQTSDRLRIFRSIGLATAALLLVGGAVFASGAISGSRHDDPGALPSVSADDHGDNGGEDATESEDASESPEASPEANEDVNDDDDSASSEASASDDETESEAEDATGSADPSASAEDHGGNSGPGGDDAHDD